MCVGSLDHLDNCKSFGVFNIFKSMFENGYIFFICQEITSFCQQIDININVRRQPVETIQKRNGENFHMVRHSYRKHLIKYLLYINRNSRRMHCSEAVLELYLVFQDHNNSVSEIGIEIELRIAFLNLDNVSRLRTETQILCNG